MTRIDGLRRADALHHREHGLVEHRHQDAVGDEAGVVGGLDRRLAEGLADTVAVCIEASDVACPRTSSTRVMSGTGLVKWIPRTLSGARSPHGAG